jgi:DmsE family decaheme c-type cytochrome
MRGNLLLLVLVAVAPLARGQEKPASPQVTPAAASTPAVPASPYAGAEQCALCHEDLSKTFARNRHHVIDTLPLGKTKTDFRGKACESCHGPGAKHAESVDPKDIRQPAKIAAVEATKICNSCHFNSRTLNGRDQGGHGRNQVSCVTCHKVHQETPRDIPVTKQITQLCQGCHSSVVAEFQRPHHHPVPEGAMSCADCHNPHGGSRVKMIKVVNGNEPGCLKCHGDKRGPFAFEHAPVKLEGCSACHESHGSSNPKMLKRHEERFVCLECHSNLGASSTLTNTIGSMPPAFHDLRSPRFNACSTCHVKVHGSQSSRALLR